MRSYPSSYPRLLRAALVTASVLASLLALPVQVGSASTMGLSPAVRQTPYQASGPTRPDLPSLIDVDMTDPRFVDLPDSVQPGDILTIWVDAAASARCVGTITFRGVPPVELPDVAVDGTICAWSVIVPGTSQPGTAIIEVQISRGSDVAPRLAGVVYVHPIGESR